jgi:hypothetical protein
MKNLKEIYKFLELSCRKILKSSSFIEKRKNFCYNLDKRKILSLNKYSNETN